MKVNQDEVNGEEIGKNIHTGWIKNFPRGALIDESCIIEKEPVMHGAGGREFQKAWRRERFEDLKVVSEG